jgi:hypothetical protein
MFLEIKMKYVRFEVFNSGDYEECSLLECGSCKTRHFGGMYASMMRVKGISKLGITLAVTSPEDSILHTHMHASFAGYC